MAKKKTAAKKVRSTINKSEEIRNYAASNPEAKPKAIAEALNEQFPGETFTPQTVSVTLSQARKKGAVGPAKGKGKGIAAKSNSKPATADNSVLGAIESAKALLKHSGSLAAAQQILTKIAE